MCTTHCSMKLSFLCWFFASANFVHATFAITEKDVVLLTQGSRGLIVVGQPYYVVSAHKGVDSARSADLLGSRRYRAASVRL